MSKRFDGGGAMETAANDDSREMLSFLWIFRSWLLQCTAHGIPKVISYTNFHRKIFWLVAVVVCSLAFLYQITDMMIDVYTYPVTVNLQITHRDQLDFPTVTMCNSNKIKESLLRNYHRNDSDLMKMVTFEDFNSIGLRDIYKLLIAPEPQDTDSEITGTTTTTGVVAPEVSDPIPRCHFFEEDADDNATTTAPPEHNDFECLEDSGLCYVYTWICDLYDDCSENSDEDPEYCGGSICKQTDYECKSGDCIDPALRLDKCDSNDRCDGKFDCSDGSDEEYEFCDLEVVQHTFTCCTSDRKIPLDQVCDGLIDCPREFSDEFGPACPSGGSSEASDHPNETMCHDPSTSSLWKYYKYPIWIPNEKVHDGRVDCFKAVDETCVWKNNLVNWTSPKDTDEFREYQNLLGKPVEMRWYSMASKEEVSSLGHKYEEMVIKCRANNKVCNESVVVNITVSQEYGNCFSFTQQDPISTSGKDYGLSIWFNLEVYDTLGLFTPTSGLKLFLTPPGKTDRNGNVFVDQTSELSLPPGFEHLVSVQPSYIQKLAKPFSLCEYYGEGTWERFNSRDECLKECMDLMKVEQCGCSDNLMVHQAPLCSLDQKEQRACVDFINENSNPNKECECPNECHVESYDVKITQLEWPTNRSIARFVANLYQDLSRPAINYLVSAINRYTEDKKENTQQALTQLRSNFGSVTVYFRDLSEAIIVERPVYNFVLIISNFGGLLGLYLGVSVLTVLEVVDFAFDAIEYLRIRGKKKMFEKNLDETPDKCNKTFSPGSVAVPKYLNGHQMQKVFSQGQENHGFF